jgi:hypothetical protein
MTITPMTELEAVNIILASIGESPVNSIENPTNVDVINAIRILRNINRRIQSKGWAFNTIESYTMTPDKNNHKIYWSPHLLYIEAKDGTKYTKNGEYLYNFTEQTFNFLNPIEVQAIFFVDFDDMPDPMRNYICAKSAKTFQSRYLGDASLAEELERDEQEAWAALQEYELDRNDFSLLNFPAVSAITMRGN